MLIAQSQHNFGALDVPDLHTWNANHWIQNPKFFPSKCISYCCSQGGGRWWPFDLETSAKICSVYVLTLHRRRQSMYGSSCVVYNHMSYCLPPLRKFEFQSGGCNKAAVACCHKKQSGNQGGGGGARKWADSTLPHKIPEPHTKIFSCEHKKSWPMRARCPFREVISILHRNMVI